MEFFDDAVSKAKEAIDVACKKTNEVVTLQKQKFNMAALESRRAKDFQLLGEIIYNKIKDDETEDGNIMVEIRVAADDAGKVIGRQGRVIKSIRTLARAAASKSGKLVDVELID